MQGIILITGGSGSFGRAFVQEALKTDVKAIRIYSRNEYMQWKMHRDFDDTRLRFMLGDIRDRDRLDACMNGVDAVIHAAALKHLSAGEYNPQEFIKTNSLGSVNVIDMACKHQVKKVLAISTDKAVEPSCLYGATKLTMERLFQDANRWALPVSAFSVLRSGNFYQSSGNVFEIWQEQAKTGVIKLTDAQMKRYFIDIHDVAKLALKCLGIMQGSEIFVPKMKEYSMYTLAKELYPECKIEITGKIDGERLTEPLFTEGEAGRMTELEDCYIVR